MRMGGRPLLSKNDIMFFENFFQLFRVRVFPLLHCVHDRQAYKAITWAATHSTFSNTRITTVSERIIANCTTLSYQSRYSIRVKPKISIYDTPPWNWQWFVSGSKCSLKKTANKSSKGERPGLASANLDPGWTYFIGAYKNTLVSSLFRFLAFKVSNCHALC